MNSNLPTKAAIEMACAELEALEQRNLEIEPISDAWAEYNELFETEYQNHLAIMEAEEKRHRDTIDILFTHLHKAVLGNT